MIETIKISGKLEWHHAYEPSDKNLDFLKDTYNFHTLDIEDCKSINQRSKIDIYKDYYFIILRFPYFDRKEKFLKTREVKIFWGQDFIITIGKSHWVIEEMFQEAKVQSKNKEIFEIETSDMLLYRMLDRLMIASIKLIRHIGITVERINREMFDKKPERTIELMSITRKNIILLNTIFKPQLQLIRKFETRDIKGYAEKMEDYWGDILDDYRRVWDITEDYGELVEGLSTTFDSLISNRTNQIVKMLTLISSILLPLTFITGLYGMNVKLPFSGEPEAFWIVIASLAVVALLMVGYFKSRKWM